MKFIRRFGFNFIALLLLSLVAGCADDNNNDADIDDFNAAHIVELRREKDKLFKSSDESPLSEQQKAAFKSLSYFPPNEDYYLPASFDIFDEPDTATIRTNSSTDVRRMLKYGKFSFSIGDSTYSLFAYKSTEEGAHSLFVPFNDATNGVKTYEVGRYLDIEEEPGANEYVIDFNMAYNPYCAYSDRYTCPRTPPENRLPISIPAGEKNYSR